MGHFRATLAGLMGFVLVAALGLAALRVASPPWAGVTYLTTRGLLGLAALNVIYCRGARRAWWLGFAIFGWGWLISLMSRLGWTFPYLQASAVLLALAPHLGHPLEHDGAPRQVGSVAMNFLQIGHDFWTIQFALIGAILGRVVYARSRDRALEPELPPIEPAARRWRLRLGLSLWLLAILGCSLGALRSTWNAPVWVGVTYLLTYGLLGFFVLGAINDRERRRRYWLGGALLGGGYLLAAFAQTSALPTSYLLAAVRDWFPAIASGTARANAQIYDALEKPVAMTFPEPTPLRDVLRYVTMATSTPSYAGIPIYLDPIGIQEAEASPTTPVTIDLLNAPLKVSLSVLLNPLGLGYEVRNGVLNISGMHCDDEPGIEIRALVDDGFSWVDPAPSRRYRNLDDPFIQVGHCLIALLLSGFGAIAGPIAAGSGPRTTA